MSGTGNLYTLTEKKYEGTYTSVSDEEFQIAKNIFDSFRYPSFKMSNADKEGLLELLPGLEIELVENAEVKSKEGVCKCGRQITLLDIVTIALKNGTHSAQFIEQVLNGHKGRIVLWSENVSDDVKAKLPEHTILISNTTLTPCLNCGQEHQVALSQKSAIYGWIIR